MNAMHHGIKYRLTAGLLGLLIGCGGGNGSGGGNGGGGGTGTGGGGGNPPPQSAPQHIVIVVLENRNYSEIIGSASMPYLNQLAQQYSLATQFYANVHPSIGNYFMMTSGEVVSTDDNFSGTFSGSNVASVLTSAGKGWKVYAESIPATGYIDGDQYPYIKHHNPFTYFDSVRNDAAQRNRIVPFEDLASDNAANTIPAYAFVVPNNLHNGHDCPAGGSTCSLAERLTAVDAWLQSNVGPLMNNPTFMAEGVVIITFDESADDNTQGGGRIPVVLAGGKIKPGFSSTTAYQFPSLLRFSLKSLGESSYPGAASVAPDMDEFLK
jgi:hypothetical protein